MVIARTVLLLVTLLGLAACGQQQADFKVRDITGLMPELQFELTRAADGEIVTAQAYEGRINVVFFGFTNCPDICPTTLARFKAAVEQLPDEQADRIRVLFVSVDPERDTAEKLHAYVSSFGDRFVGLRGPQSELREVTKRYRVTYGYGEPDESGYYSVSHSSAAFVFDRNNEIRLLIRGDDPIDHIAHDLGVLARG